MSPYLTKTRLALLQAVADGAVTESRFTPYHSQMRPRDGRSWTTVTSRCEEARRAGWIEVGEDAGRWSRSWQLTEAGRQILEAAQ